MEGIYNYVWSQVKSRFLTFLQILHAGHRPLASTEPHPLSPISMCLLGPYSLDLEQVMWEGS